MGSILICHWRRPSFDSKLPDIPISNSLPLYSYCFERLSEFADRPCLIDGATDKIYTYADVDLASRCIAAGLRRIGVSQGVVIMNLIRNSTEFVFAFLGASLLGAIATTANPLCTPVEIHKQLVASGAKVIVTEACMVEKVQEYSKEELVACSLPNLLFDHLLALSLPNLIGIADH